jgi:propanol-preferring alcohol dehydrogenase
MIEKGCKRILYLKYLDTRFGGQIMCVSLPPVGNSHIDVDPGALATRHLLVKGTFG